MEAMKPKDIVKQLDKFIVGQNDAKKAVATALRNRWRRQQLSKEMQEEIFPKNIILIGPTGIGKTEIARRISKMTKSPFVKVEASKFTEVGYVGRDVESMVRDLVDLSVNIVKGEFQERIQDTAREMAEERLLDLLFPRSFEKQDQEDEKFNSAEITEREKRENERRKKVKEALKKGVFDKRMVEIDAQDQYGGMIEIFSSSGIEEIGMQMKDMLPGFFKKNKKRRKVSVPEALEILTNEEASKLIDMDKVVHEAIERAEQTGIVFVDEMDKISGRESGHGPDVSREGVQRDLLPIIEGSTVSTKYGMVRTDHILFLAAGAFNVSKPSDLIPELQGRFPIRVDVTSLTADDMFRILVEPQNALTKQYKALMQTEGIELEFNEDALKEIAARAVTINEQSENIGARRLHTVIEKLLEVISFEAPDMKKKKIVIDIDYVKSRLDIEKILASEDVRKKRKPGFAVESEN